MSASLFISYSRSGGSLLARCLAALPNTLVISEVHPQFKTGQDLAEQARLNYGVDVGAGSYLDQVKNLHEYCLTNGKHLIIRDWSFIDFTPHAINHFKPSRQFSNYNLLKEEIDLKAFAIVRNPIDIWISRWFPPGFFESYFGFAEKLVSEKISHFKFEEFCSDPDRVMKDLSKLLDIEYSDSYRMFGEQRFVGGHDPSKSWSRKGQHIEIALPPRKYLCAPRIRELESNPHLKKANELLNYSSVYAEMKQEDAGLANKFMENLKYWLRRLGITQSRDAF